MSGWDMAGHKGVDPVVNLFPSISLSLPECKRRVSAYSPVRLNVMLLSYEPAFLFVHIDKAAGSSIQLALQPYAPVRKNSRLFRRLVVLGVLNRIGGIYRRVEFPEHANARLAQRCLPSAVYDRLFKFAFVRNPWDRLVSRYAYLLRNEKHPRHGYVSRMKGFEEYVAWEIQRGKMFQYTYVTNTHGEWIVDFVGYYERLHTDFATVCARVGVKAELPRANTSSHRDYRACYTSELRDLVGKVFQRDLELFGYTFEGPTEGKLLHGLAGSPA
jgi:hypothetical protein